MSSNKVIDKLLEEQQQLIYFLYELSLMDIKNKEYVDKTYYGIKNYLIERESCVYQELCDILGI